VEKPAEGGVLFAKSRENVEPFGGHFSGRGEGAPGQHHMDVAAATVDYMMMAGAVGRIVVIVGIPMGMPGIAG
jgi:hypothetical protein